jgi:hypothetical protein
MSGARWSSSMKMNCETPNLAQTSVPRGQTRVPRCSFQPQGVGFVSDTMKPTRIRHDQSFAWLRNFVFRRASNSSSVRGQFACISRESARSASSRPPVWHRAQ